VKLVKKCRHGRGLQGGERDRAWRGCGCTWYVAEWDAGRRRYGYEPVGADRHGAERALRSIREPGTGDGVRDVGDRYIAELRAGGRAVRTLDQYGIYLERAAEFFGERFPVSAIDTDHLERFRARLTETGRSVRYATHCVGWMRAALRHAVREGTNGMRGVPDLAPPVAPRRGKRSDRLTLDECERLIAAMPSPWKSAGELILVTGLRIGELMDLTEANYDAERGILHVHSTRARGDAPSGPPKTETSRRPIALSDRGRAIIAARILEVRDGERLWPGRMEGACRGGIRKGLDASGLAAPGRGWHMLRHGHRDLIERAGASVRAAAARMGHGHQFATTESYGWGAEAAEVVGLDEARRRDGVPLSG
jgi:integrase